MSYKNKVANLRKKFRITGQYFGIFYNKKKGHETNRALIY